MLNILDDSLGEKNNYDMSNMSVSKMKEDRTDQNIFLQKFSIRCTLARLLFIALYRETERK
jgi:hypothetical protein